MKFSLWTAYGALNSKPVFDAFEHSLISNGHTVTRNDSNTDVNVIWSVLFNGRMAGNQAVWEQKKPTIVLEVGGINRGTTWKVGLNGINRDAYFGEQDNDRSRADHLGLVCKPWRSNGDFILICGQHDKSLQWQGMPRMSNWFLETYDEIRQYTLSVQYVFRPHPRCRLDHILSVGLKMYTGRSLIILPIHTILLIWGLIMCMGYCQLQLRILGYTHVSNGVPAFVGP